MNLETEYYKRWTEAKAEVSRLTRERNALLIGMVARSLDDAEMTAAALEDGLSIAAMIAEAIALCEDEPGMARYLDLPAALGDERSE